MTSSSESATEDTSKLKEVPAPDVSTILGRTSCWVSGREKEESDIMESSVCVVPGRKAVSISPLESSMVINSRKNRILTLFSRMKRRPMLQNSSWMVPLAASSRDIAWITSWIHVSTVSLLKRVSFERTVKLRGTVGIWPVGRNSKELTTCTGWRMKTSYWIGENTAGCDIILQGAKLAVQDVRTCIQHKATGMTQNNIYH